MTVTRPQINKISQDNITKVTPKYIADLFTGAGMRCSCALESWEPTKTGHQARCMIHVAANALHEKYKQNKGGKA